MPTTYLQVPSVNPNLPFPSTQPPPNPALNHDYLSLHVSSLAQQNQSLSQINQTLITQTQQLQAQHKMFESQLTQMDNPPPPLVFPSHPNLTHPLNLHRHKPLNLTQIIVRARRSSKDHGLHTPLLLWLLGMIWGKGLQRVMSLK